MDYHWKALRIKLYILKYSYGDDDNDTNTTIFTANSADYGGAAYMDDDSNYGTCASNTKTECFFQVLAIHDYYGSDIKTQCMYFSQNFANISGSTLYGGLLDRFAHFKQNYEYKGESYFKDISTGESTLISSLPVQVCICISNEPNCTHQSYTEVIKGETFTLSVVAVDQIVQPVGATIQTSLHFTESGLAEGHLTR